MDKKEIIRIFDVAEDFKSLKLFNEENFHKVLYIIYREFGFKEKIFNIENIETAKKGAENFILLLATLPNYSVDETIDYTIKSLKEGVSFLSEKGRMACVVPVTFLNHPKSAELRKTLVKEKLLDKIVLLDSGMSYFDQQIAIFFLKKETHFHVKFINEWKEAYEDVISALLTFDILPSENELHDAGFEIYDDYLDFYFYPDFSKHVDLVSFDTICSNHYSFNSNLYIRGLLPERKGFYLTEGDMFAFSIHDECDYIEDVWGSTPNIFYDFLGNKHKRSDEEITALRKFKKGFIEGKVLDLSELRGFTSYASHLDVASIKTKKYEGIYYELQNKKALILPLVGSWMPTYLEVKGKEVVYIPLDTMCIMDEEDWLFKNKEFDLEYIANEFCKDYVKKQLHYQNGRLDSIDLGYLRLYLPNSTEIQSSFERQREIVKQERQKHIQLLESELGIERRELHLRKHRLTNMLAQMKDAFDLLNSVRKEQGGVLHDADLLDESIEENVGNYFEQIRNSMNKVMGLASRFVDEQHPTFEDVSIRKLMDEFVTEFPKKNYRIDLKIEKPQERYMVRIDKDMFNRGLENIIHNAEMHGFLDVERKDYCLRINVYEKIENGLPYVDIIISNNGCPMDASVEKDKVFDWGYGSHTGLGLWELKHTIEQHFGGKIQLNEVPSDSDFPVEYEILLPKV